MSDITRPSGANEPKHDGPHSVSARHSGFTPGPWHVGPHYKHDVESREGRICECAPMGSERAVINARLIAAAPDLLEACKLAVDSFPITQVGEAERRRAVCRAAIAKAEGK